MPEGFVGLTPDEFLKRKAKTVGYKKRVTIDLLPPHEHREDYIEDCLAGIFAFLAQFTVKESGENPYCEDLSSVVRVLHEQKAENERLRQWRYDEALLATRACAEGWGMARLAREQADLARRYEKEHRPEAEKRDDVRRGWGWNDD